MESEIEPTQDPEREAQVRELLAEAGSASTPEPMPAYVAARLDRTLADLVTQQSTGQPTHQPTGSLRSRWAPRLTVAAAAVLVLGVGGVTATGLGAFESSREADSSAGGAAEQSDSRAPGGTPAIASASFADDVAALLESPARLRPEARKEAGDTTSSTCPGPAATDAASRRSVLLDGERAVLLVHPPRSGGRLVEAWTCDGERRLAATTVTR